MLTRFLSMSYRIMSTNSSSSSNNSLVLTSKNGRIFNIFINRPERKNCVNHATALKLIEAFERGVFYYYNFHTFSKLIKSVCIINYCYRFENDSTVDIAILSGKGETFCSGYDLSEVASGAFPSGDEASEFLEKYRFMGPSMMTLSKPLIAAIEGFAVAGGLELSLLADLRVAAINSQFGVLCRRFGVPLIDGGTVRLPAMIGFSRAMDLILTGRQFDAKVAEEWGLVNRLAEPGQAYKVAEMLAKEIIKHPQECLKADRKSAYYASFEAKSYQDAFNFELNNGIPVLSEAVKGAGRFIRKEHKL